ncbi:DNA polymerase IV [Arcanobacterium pinnipediorum]|uniref:DNA polymerase IV n=1 Tax=Arcanobacterium pinnipediorum TaxID=1503041 RepID=A0ABY5AJ51_9ACTO|nr:DNA polymerase IV [Arcanobacterium pinnipediorum]USR80020.1 DNA polymerase IV [Arcanobacterium pinnipediorum]
MSRAPRSHTARRFWGDDDSGTPILHIDMDAFFVSVELLYRPDLIGKPVAVGGQDRGVISAASYEARTHGVNSAMPVAQARRRCPHLIILPAHHDRYAAVSERIMNYLRSITPLVEQLSVDEAFLDVKGAQKLFGSPVQIAHQIRAHIRSAEGLAASVGIASTKHVAKVASAHAKPDGLLLVPKERTQDFLLTLPVGALWGVGDKTRGLLHDRGIIDVSDILTVGRQRLVAILGSSQGNHLYDLASGKDERKVQPVREEKSVSKEHTFFEPMHKHEDALRMILTQAHDVGRRLRAHDLYGRTVTIKVRYSNFHTITRSVTLGAGTNTGADIFDAARSLFDQLPSSDLGIRLLGVKVDQLSPAGQGIQLALGDDGRRSRAEETMDSIREKFGHAILQQGSLMETDSRQPPTI